MKNIIFLSSLCALLGCLLVFQNCGDNKEPNPAHTGNAGEGCNNGKCNNGYTCVDNTCQCPGGLVYNGHCLQFPEGVNVLVGTNAACYCYDTLILAFDGVGENRNVISTIKQDDLLGSAITPCTYITRPEGDSVHVGILPMYCNQTATNKLYTEAAGVFQPDGSLRMELIFHDAKNYTHIVDHCTVLMKKP